MFCKVKHGESSIMGSSREVICKVKNWIMTNVMNGDDKGAEDVGGNEIPDSVHASQAAGRLSKSYFWTYD